MGPHGTPALLLVVLSRPLKRIAFDIYPKELNDMEKITTQIKLIVQIVRCIHFKRELSKLDPEPHLNFWRLIHGGLLDLSVLEWTKIFGSNGEPTHWKCGDIVDDHDTFRRELLIRTGLTQEEWNTYWNDMKSYRNEEISHHFDNLSRKCQNYPTLDVALISCYFYYEYLIKKAREHGEAKFPDNLGDYCKKFSAQTRAIAKLALEATANCKEEVW
ncbi:MAG: hypothetical protein WCH01_05570 [Methylococcaceae bacterium]